MSPSPPTLEITEQHQLLDALLKRRAPELEFRRGLRNYTMALLMLDAGLRISEVCELLITDLVIGGEPVNAVHLTAQHTKNKTERTVPLSSRLKDAIGEMLERCWNWCVDMPAAYAFFGYEPHSPLTPRQVERIIQAAARRSIGRPVNPHMLRHTFASKLMRLTNARVVQDCLGHRSLQSTQVYTHPNSDDKKMAIDALDSVNSGNK